MAKLQPGTRVYGTATVDLSISVNSTLTSNIAGGQSALMSSGGIKVSKDLYVGGTTVARTSNISAGSLPTTTTNAFSFLDVSQSTSTNTGALVVAGGVGVGKNVVIGGTTVMQQSQQLLTSINSATGVVTHDLSTSTSFWHTGMTGNFTANFVNANSVTSRLFLVNLILNQGATPRMCNAVQINGNTQTVTWANGLVPVGLANNTDRVVFTILQTGTSAYTVLGQLVSYRFVPIATYYITPSSLSINEGSSINASITATNATTGTTIYWKVITNSTTTLFSPSTGSAVVSSALTASLSLSVLNNFRTEGPQTFNIALVNSPGSNLTLASSNSVTVNDTSQGTTYNFQNPILAVNEGATTAYYVTCTNVTNGTNLYWRIDHITSTSTDFVATTGSFIVNSNIGSFNVSTVADATTEGTETFVISVLDNLSTGSVLVSTAPVSINDTSQTPAGQIAFTSAGTYTWTAPAGIYSVSVVAVGGGGGGPGGSNGNGGGGGGALAYGNNISVIPGATYLVAVGAGGTSSQGVGGDSYFISTSTLNAGGGKPGAAGNAPGGATVVGGGGGAGGYGGPGGTGGGAPSGVTAGGLGGVPSGTALTGGGAGGVGGKANAYASDPGQSALTAGTTGTFGGGGGGGGSFIANPNTPFGGGGVGIFGQGADGAGGSLGLAVSYGSTSTNNGGSGGGGGNGMTNNGYTYTDPGSGGYYGGGAQGYQGRGSPGAVRIIWEGASGITRQFPYTNTGDYPFLYNFTRTAVLNVTTSSVYEGSTMTIYVSSTNVVSSAVLYWKINNITTTATDFLATTGSFTITANTGSFVVQPLIDSNSETIETFSVSLFSDLTTGTVIATTVPLSVINQSVTYNFVNPATSLNEGSTGTTVFAFTCTNVADNTPLYWRIDNITTTASDFSATTGSFIINSNTGNFSITATADNLTEGNETFVISVLNDLTTGSVLVSTGAITISDTSKTPLQAEFTTPGTYSWTAPAGVTSVCVVCVGGGGGGAWSFNSASLSGCGGGGGGLGWKNNIAVTPGNSYTVVVGAGGTMNIQSGTAGGDSYFINATTVKGGGGGAPTGSGNTAAVGGTYVGTGGGNGGGGGAGGSNNKASGGGGAGGYAGTGGYGGSAGGTPPAAGAGGGGGGGSGWTTQLGAGGGGVGIYGQGANGTAGAQGGGVGGYAYGPTAEGGGGSGGGSGSNNGGGDFLSFMNGGNYGGGCGGSGNNTGFAGGGGGGAVRIIWGAGRSFPSTNTTDQFQ